MQVMIEGVEGEIAKPLSLTMFDSQYFNSSKAEADRVVLDL